MLFVQYCQAQHLSILNTWFDHPIHHRVTWHHPNGVHCKVYDYSLSGSWLRQFVQDVRVRNSYFSSDHRLVVTKLKTPANKAARWFQRKAKGNKPNLLLLQDENISSNVQSAINEHLSLNNTHPTTIKEIHTKIIESMKKGRKKIPLQSEPQQNIPWNYDTELTDLITSRRLLRNQKATNNIKMKIKEITKKLRTKVRKIRNNNLKTKPNKSM